MESCYGIGVRNRYDLFLNEEEDPLDILRQQEEEKEKKKDKGKDPKAKGTKTTTGAKPTAPALSTTKKPASKDTTTRNIEPSPINKKEGGDPRSRTTKSIGGGERGGRFAPREDQKDIEERKNRRNREDRPPNATSEFRDRGGDGEMRRGGRGGPRGGPGRGRGRGGRGGGFDGRGKREFDRQSGSDKSVKPTEKRDGGGAHNWGTVKDDFEGESFNMQMSSPGGGFGTEETGEPAERSGDEENLGGEPTEPKNGNADEEQSGEAVIDGEEKEFTAEDAKEMTLDEWKREQENKRSVPKFNLRKPGEGEDNAQWKKLFVLKKKEKEATDDDEEEETDVSDEDDDDFVRKGRMKQVVDIEINFADSRRGGRGRGGRGMRGGDRGGRGMRGGERGGRGGRGRNDSDREQGEGGGRGGGFGAPEGGRRGGFGRRDEGGPRKNQQSAPKVDDWNDFPSLIAA